MQALAGLSSFDVQAPVESCIPLPWHTASQLMWPFPDPREATPRTDGVVQPITSRAQRSFYAQKRTPCRAIKLTNTGGAGGSYLSRVQPECRHASGSLAKLPSPTKQTHLPVLVTHNNQQGAGFLCTGDDHWGGTWLGCEGAWGALRYFRPISSCNGRPGSLGSLHSHFGGAEGHRAGRADPSTNPIPHAAWHAFAGGSLITLQSQTWPQGDTGPHLARSQQGPAIYACI